MEKRTDTPTNDTETTELSAKNPAFFQSAQDALQKYSQCTICGSHLHFTHVTDFSRNLTQETARCPECGIRARQITHRLQ